MNPIRSIVTVVANAASPKLVLAVAISSAVTGGVAGPLAYQAFHARDVAQAAAAAQQNQQKNAPKGTNELAGGTTTTTDAPRRPRPTTTDDHDRGHHHDVAAADDHHRGHGDAVHLDHHHAAGQHPDPRVGVARPRPRREHRRHAGQRTGLRVRRRADPRRR